MNLRTRVWVALLAAAAGCGDDAATAKGPHVFLISLDTCRADRLGCYGNERGLTPELDALAAESLVFTDCWANSTNTGPSHRSILSGQYVHRHGMFEPFRIEMPDGMAQLLHDAGYASVAVTGGGYLRNRYGFDHGFDTFLEPSGTPFIRGLAEIEAVAAALLQDVPGRPLFFLLHGYDPHCPYWPPEPFRGRYSGWYEGALDARELCGRKDFNALIEAGEFGADERRYLNDLYDAGVASGDAAIGRFLGLLREKGLYEESLIIVTSDHGENLGEHDWVGHHGMWEEQLRVPLIVKLPGAARTGAVREPVELVDVLPTVFRQVGTAVPAGVQGRDLLAVDLASTRPPRRLAKVSGLEAVRVGKWKLHFRRSKGEIVDRALFDLEADPGELQDLHPTVEGRARFDALLADYQEWRDATRAADQRHRGRRLPENPLTAEEAAGLAATGYADLHGDKNDDGGR